MNSVFREWVEGTSRVSTLAHFQRSLSASDPLSLHPKNSLHLN